MTSDKLRAFFEQAAAYLRDPRFQAAEVDYKLCFQGELLPAMTAYRSGASALAHMSAALRSPNQNMIHWRDVDPLLTWCKPRDSSAPAALRALWFGTDALDRRFGKFAAALNDAGISQPGAQLSITSTLLIGLSAETHPPIRTQKFSAAFAAAGFPPFQRDQDAAARYTHALQFLDHLIERAPIAGLRLQHRLEAQGLVWCIGGGWDGFANAGEPIAATSNEMPDEPEATRLVVEAARGTRLTETEKEALVLSRRGQGQFRNRLIGTWGRCAVTGCRDLRLLRASHLKPWRHSTNSERLDPFNGLLLAAHLDSTLDCGLITFTDDGRIRLSSTLSSADGKCLGIHRAMTLRYVDTRHRAYLRFHRENVFRA